MKLKAHRLAFFLVLIAGICRPFSAFADQRSPFTLASQAEVDCEGIFLSQLLAGSSASTVPHIRLADAPSPGKSYVITRAQINQILQKVAPDSVCTNWTGADKIRVSRRMKSLQEMELTAMLTEALQQSSSAPAGELELRLLRPWTPVNIPDEALTVKLLDLPATGLNPSMIVRFEIRGPKELLGVWQVNVQIMLWREIWVARYPLKRGQLLSEADLAKERRDVLSLRNTVSEDFLSLGSFEAAENVQAGAHLTSRSFRQKPWVYRGQVVDAVVRDGLLSISLRVEVLEDGLPGQTIRIRNVQTKRELRGRVQNEQTVQVLL